VTPWSDVALKNDHNPPRSFHLQQLSPKVINSFQVILVNFGEVAVGVSPGSKSGIGLYVGNGVGVHDQVAFPTVLQDFQILPK
jgi:hypothetical protein